MNKLNSTELQNPLKTISEKLPSFRLPTANAVPDVEIANADSGEIAPCATFLKKQICLVPNFV
jgi:hypothetical protein